MKSKHLLILLMLSLTNAGWCQEAWSGSNVIPDRIPCVRYLERNFFTEGLVNQALSLYQIPQGVWSPIFQTLQRKSLDVLPLMKKKTAGMIHNPIEYPMQPGPTAKLLKEVLFEIFLDTLKNYQVNERPAADFAFDYIFQQQLPEFVKCFGQEAVDKLKVKFE